ncbi:putative ATP-binding multidrug cassette transport protein [Tilletiaria anomala UBC 951]|uniref:Putative ATP-binding multidrug cassette transport protein n=1 Tax=Tilletiaria anomala (strain ATCC 24038 / CBS 436.72 / UBC 951) TaxID=1037660 RepID=A0A066VTA3_TILAU|nr:putative ATP-binding multidrug cassette transport protein [Tilletiaria anomala UBC 951]KDN44701.1 putative ATP-binding multidrug cassette transport protein [Tilletiaria anomala UBC 951]
MSAPGDAQPSGRVVGGGAPGAMGDESRAVSTPNNSDDGINVEQAKRQFDELEKQLAQESEKFLAETGGSDIEKNGSDAEVFNLREWLAGAEEKGREAGMKRKSLGVSWGDLGVIGAASVALNVPTIPSMALFEIIGPIFGILKMVGINLMKPKTRHLLEGFSGVARPGEMVLVLGRPGAGCSTFLKTIANQRTGFIDTEGDVHYGGISAQDMSKRYRGEVTYCEEDDMHHATLTVQRTIDFALRVKQTSQKFPDSTRKTFRKTIRDALLQMFNIPHTKHTLVGSPTVRGVSGGERKRVSIIEALATGASVLCWDNATRGLDASTALDYAKAIRVLTDVMGTTSFLTAYQASEGIWEQCDKVIIIDEGRCVYFGPRAEARQYFINLGFGDRPRQTSADYVTGCTDRYERIFQEGRSEADVPTSPEELEKAYRASRFFQEAMDEKAQFDKAVQAEEKERADEFRVAVMEQKHPGTGRKSQYTVSFAQQVYALWLRQMQMIIGDKFDICMSYITSIVIALLAGGLFFELPTNSAGLFTRGGVLFILLLFNALSAFAELPSQMLGRPILARQASFAFYRPSALMVAQLLADFPFGIPRATLFVIILYFMAGLHRSAGAFFTAWLIVLVSYYAFRALFSLFGTITRNFFSAARLAASVMAALTLWAGYVVPQAAMARWLFWISYINPIFYAFEGMMINEFQHTNFTCDGAQVLPSGPNYPSGIGPNQVCTVAGAKPGSDIIVGLDYLRVAFGYEKAHLWRNVGILFAFLIGLIVITCAAIELMDQGAFASAMTVKKVPSEEEKALNKRLEDRRSDIANKVDTKLEVHGQSFTWSKLNYTVPVKGGQKQLLDNVDGFVVPGTMTALMGSSGAGKTTLLDVLADRKNIGVIKGDRLIEGKNIDTSFQRQCGYAEQQDIHEPMCSVREALRFSAYLRQPYHVPKEEKDRYVEEIIELLELSDLADAIIGYPGFGLGVGDRKRVTIGVELAAKPEMLLFLDEPTSGLDGQSAFTIVRVLKKLCDAGQTILCTIHQPSALLFETFDRLLLLERGGRTVYFGPIGKDGKQVIDYFAARGAQCPATTNPAEYMLDAIGAGSQPRVGSKDWADHYLESELYQENLRRIDEINAAGRGKPTPEDRRTEYATPWMVQFKVVLDRTMLSTWRQPAYQYTRVFQHLMFALLTGLLFLQLGDNLSSLQYRVFVIFMLAIIPAIILAQIMPFWITNRSVWIREETSKTFSGTVFAVTQIISELPYALVCSVIFFVLLYYLTGFNTSSDRAAYFFIMVFIVELWAITTGSAVASFSKSIYFSTLFVPFIIVILTLTCGVLSPPQAMSNSLYSKFFYNLNPMRFAISPLIANEFHGLQLRCSASELIPFTPPAGQTCAQWAAPYIAMAGGYLQQPDARDVCRYCTFSSGDEFMVPFGIHFSERGRDAGIMIAFIAFNTVVTMLCTKYLRFSNR